MATKKAAGGEATPRATKGKKRGASDGSSSPAATTLPSAEALERRLSGAPAATPVASAKPEPAAKPQASELVEAGEGEGPNGLVELPPEMFGATRGPPEDEEPDAPVVDLPQQTLAHAVLRALRFTDKAGSARYVRVYSNLVVGSGVRGSVYAPWNAPSVTGTIVDGLALYRALRACGASASIQQKPDGDLVVRGGGDKFTLKRFADVLPDPLPFPPADTKYVAASPAAFRQAAGFAGDDKIEPPHLSGVAIMLGHAAATDRRSAFMARAFTDNTLPLMVLPRSSFDDITDEAVYLATLPQTSHVVIAVPSTGEYRIIRCFDAGFPDVQKAFDLYAPQVTFTVTINKAQLESALKRMTIVQSRLASVTLKIQKLMRDAPDGVDPFVVLLSISGGFGAADFEASMAVDSPAFPRTPSEAPYTMNVSAPLLMCACKAALGTSVRFAFGPDHTTPIVIDEPSYRALLLGLVL